MSPIDKRDFNNMREMAADIQEMATQRAIQEKEEATPPSDPIETLKNPKDAKVFKQLQAAAGSSHISAESAVGQRLRHECAIDGSLKRDYAKLKGDNDRLAFRKSWVGRKLQSMVVGKSRQKDWKEADVKRGRYLTTEKIADEYGFVVDPAKAVASAKAYSEKVASMGGRWATFDSMSG